MLKARKKADAKKFEGSSYIFPAHSALGHISEPKEDDANLPGPHALRHVYITCATAGCNLPLYVVKLLVNHSLPKADVSLGYVWAPPEQLRDAAEKVCAYILQRSKEKLTRTSTKALAKPEALTEAAE